MNLLCSCDKSSFKKLILNNEQSFNMIITFQLMTVKTGHFQKSVYILKKIIQKSYFLFIFDNDQKSITR